MGASTTGRGSMIETGRAIVVCLVCLSILFFSQRQAVAAQSGSAQLKREKVRLLEMKAQEEKTEAELTEALRKEKMSKERVSDLQERLRKQRALITAIDRRISTLAERQDKTEKQVRNLVEAHGKAKSRLRQETVTAFEGHRRSLVWSRAASSPERARFMMNGYLDDDLQEVKRLSMARDRKRQELSGIEKQVVLSEKQMAREQKTGERLLSNQEAEQKRLSEIAREKEAKQRKLLTLREGIKRMESLVARVERQARERERQLQKKAKEEAARGIKPKPVPQAPRRFASLPGGMSAPLSGKVVTRFGQQYDQTFNVTIENSGVGLEAESGAQVKAAGSGEVAFTGAVSGYGNVIILQHGAGLFSVYGKLDSFMVKTGRKVSKGDVVGALPRSSSGKSVLYFELRAGGAAIDPASVIAFN
ncbi:MAG: peptidoglycan DD-metalloendopeptidase family protein [Syntrophorhabdaceae bacterium]|nr:peptidoglycan DD-metalloendopeptidase family protein [Syntrophorhabdaceae bacterium]